MNDNTSSILWEWEDNNTNTQHMQPTLQKQKLWIVIMVWWDVCVEGCIVGGGREKEEDDLWDWAKRMLVSKPSMAG